MSLTKVTFAPKENGAVNNKRKGIIRRKRNSIFYLEITSKGKTIKAVGLGKNDGSITLTRKQWKLFISSLILQI